MWRMRNLTLEGKITVFKSLTLSKIISLEKALPILKVAISALEKIQEKFIWKDHPPKIKHETICNTYEKRELKNVEINSKLRNLQCSWIQKLYDDSFHERN